MTFMDREGELEPDSTISALKSFVYGWEQEKPSPREAYLVSGVSEEQAVSPSGVRVGGVRVRDKTDHG